MIGLTRASGWQPRIESKTTNNLSVLMGFAVWPFMPDFSAARRSSSKALAVMARIGMEASFRSGRARMARVAA